MKITQQIRKPWAIHPDWLSMLSGLDMPMVKRESENACWYESEGVAVIKVHGVIGMKKDFWAWFFDDGAYLEEIQNALKECLANENIKAIVLNINSPGGTVEGVAEMCDMIFQARNVKPIVAYNTADCCSAGYWLASQASKIVNQETGMMGCIGVLCEYMKEPANRELMDKYPSMGVIVSSMTPNKNADPNTDSGLSQLQTICDDMAKVMINGIARGRGKSPEEVTARFGDGSVFVGQKAIDNTMADVLGNLSDAILLAANLADGVQEEPMAKPKGEMVDTADITKEWIEKNYPEIVKQIQDEAAPEEVESMTPTEDTAAMDKAKEEGAADEQKRQAAIDEVTTEGAAEEKMKQEAKADRKMTAADLALKINASRKVMTEAQRKQREEEQKALAQKLSGVGGLNASTGDPLKGGGITAAMSKLVKKGA